MDSDPRLDLSPKDVDASEESFEDTLAILEQIAGMIVSSPSSVSIANDMTRGAGSFRVISVKAGC